jgi:L-lactate dehydrogenase complex protein LldG
MTGNPRDQILASLRNTRIPETPLPSLDGQWLTFDDRRRQFESVLAAVGGKLVALADVTQVNNALEDLPVYREAERVCSVVPGVVKANVDVESIEDPHDLEDVDFFVGEGQFGVAENAAVWLTAQTMQLRTLFFICQHMALVLRADQIVDNMHQAYDRLEFGSNEFGLFLSGPSKTADIEQSLVIGAHGARSLTVFLVG